MTEARHDGAAPASPDEADPGDASSSQSSDLDPPRPAAQLPAPPSPSPSPALPGPDLTKARRENFPVAARLLPARKRHHLLNVYAFARLVDDIGDESAADRAGQLDMIERELERAYTGSAQLPVLRGVAVTARECGIPPEPFQALIAANRQDQVVTRYGNFDELLEYCALSANPVGRVVLHVFEAATPERISLSDRICTALQLVEHWQDVAEDLARGRVYLPAEDLARFGCAESDLAEPVAGARVRDLMAFESRRTARMLDEGAPLVGTLTGFARLATAGYVAGGRAALAAIAARDHDVLSGPPEPHRARLGGEWLHLLARGR